MLGGPGQSQSSRRHQPLDGCGPLFAILAVMQNVQDFTRSSIDMTREIVVRAIGIAYGHQLAMPKGINAKWIGVCMLGAMNHGQSVGRTHAD